MSRKTIYRSGMQADHDYIAGAKRDQLPGPLVRAIALAGAALGAVGAALLATSLAKGLLIGGGAGLAACQVVTHLLARRRAISG